MPSSARRVNSNWETAWTTPRRRSVPWSTQAMEKLDPGGDRSREETEGARLRLDGRSHSVPHRPRGCFLGPTVLDDVTPEMFVGREEIFGPVVSVMRAPDLDAAITLTNRSRYGNTVSLFTQSGAAARTFRCEPHSGRDGRHQSRRAGMPDGVLSRSAAGRVRFTVISMRRAMTPWLSTRERK